MSVMTPRQHKAILVVFIASFFSVIGSIFFHFLYKKDYSYLVEASCDPAKEKCFFRDCEANPNNCPPNMLSLYKSFYVTANDFKKCSDNSCFDQCTSGVIQCEVIFCNEQKGDSCEGIVQ